MGYQNDKRASKTAIDLQLQADIAALLVQLTDTEKVHITELLKGKFAHYESDSVEEWVSGIDIPGTPTAINLRHWLNGYLTGRQPASKSI